MQPAGRYFGIEDDLPVPTSVHNFSPESPYVPVGEARQFALSVNDQNGNEMVNGMASYWSSSDESVATINSGGVLTALSEGTTVITGRCADIAVSKTVTSVLLGDANDDGVVNQADTLRVLKQIVGLSSKPAADTELFTKTDVHQNGLIEVGDALYIAQYNVGLRDAWFALKG